MHPNDGRVVSNFIVQALKNEPITIYGDGSQTRSFCYVDDLIEGFMKFMGDNVSETGPINLGNPVEFSIIDLAKKIIQLTKSSSKLKFLKLPEDDPVQRCPDIINAKKLIKWEPKIDLESGLIKTVDYFKGLQYD